MKKFLCLLMLGMMLEIPDVEANINRKAETKTVKAASEYSTLRQKRRNRQRKGFLWGIFRKRNACDCPKH